MTDLAVEPRVLERRRRIGPAADLQPDLAQPEEIEVVVVYKTKEVFGGLSNMASGYPLQINGVCILTTEALYQACRRITSYNVCYTKLLRLR